uniref:Uncharacterized protein n=1 Tax=Arundo donax TaxID=35708 RepID=A0A0A9HMP1_ARUDO
MINQVQHLTCFFALESMTWQQLLLARAIIHTTSFLAKENTKNN